MSKKIYEWNSETNKLEEVSGFVAEAVFTCDARRRLMSRVVFGQGEDGMITIEDILEDIQTAKTEPGQSKGADVVRSKPEAEGEQR